MKSTLRSRIGSSVVIPLILVVAGCSRSNNLLEGRVETRIAEHAVVVTDCYRTSVPSPERLEDTPNGEAAYRFAPCKDVTIELRGAELIVNRTSYGKLKASDTITVDHGKVLVNDSAATAMATQQGVDASGPK